MISIGASVESGRSLRIDDQNDYRDVGKACTSPSRASIGALEHASCLAGRIGNNACVERRRNLGVDRNASDSSVSGKTRDDGTPCTSAIDSLDDATATSRVGRTWNLGVEYDARNGNSRVGPSNGHACAMPTLATIDTFEDPTTVHTKV